MCDCNPCDLPEIAITKSYKGFSFDLENGSFKVLSKVHSLYVLSTGNTFRLFLFPIFDSAISFSSQVMMNTYYEERLSVEKNL